MSSFRLERVAVWFVARGWFVPGLWILRRKLAQDPGDGDLQLMVAHCAAALGRADEARRVLGGRRDADALAVHVVVAARALRREDALAAVDALASQTEPDDPRLLSAEALARNLPMLAPAEASGASMLQRLGLVLLRLGWMRASRRIYRRLHRAHPEDPDFQLLLATCEVAIGQHAVAAALLSSRRDPDALACRIELAVSAGQIDAANALVADLWDQTEEGDSRRDEVAAMLAEHGGTLVEGDDGLRSSPR
jgi:hypothetical protein